MSDFQFQDENSIKAVFNMEVGREMNDHNKLYNKSLPNQHPMSAITDLETTISNIGLDILAEENRAKGIEGELSNLTTDSKANLVSAINEVDSHADTNATNLSNHINDKSNPHEVTKAQVGLGNCDNTADIDKPISTATHTALDNITNGTTSIAYDNTTSGLNATTLQGAIDEIDSDLDNVEDLIPSAASSSNQLADKSYVDTADNGLQEQINMLNARGRFLALWNCATGLAQSNPPESPYIYKAGDYFIIGTVGTTNYKPTGSSYVTGQASTVVETESVDVNDVYYYDGANWTLQINTQKEVSFASVAGSPYDNTNLSNALNAKQNVIDSTHKLASDLVDDSGQTNKFVTASEKSQITTNASNITDLQTNKADKSTTYTKTEVDNIASGKANVGLDNLNASGQMIIDSQNGTISNCILEIPQNIKLEIVNNKVVIKSGTTIVDTGETYATYTYTSDHEYEPAAGWSSVKNTKFMIFGVHGSGYGYNINNIKSGTDVNADTIVFNTNDKKIYVNGTVNNGIQYPICVVDVDANGNVSFAKDSNGNDMIFNGAGFIGHHIFTYPQTKYLSGNGKNDDGTLASYENTLNSLTITEMSSATLTDDWFKTIVVRGNNNTVAGTTYWRNVKSYDELLPQSARLQYVEDDNIAYAYTSGGYQAQSRIYLCTYVYDGSSVTDFAIRQPVRLATTEMLDTKQADITTLTGYDSTQTQTLKNINGVLQWVTD